MMHLLVAQLRLPEHLRLQPKRHEILRPLPLQNHLRPLLVNGHVQLVLHRVVKRVRLRLKLVAVLDQQRAQLRRLRGSQRGGVKRERLGIFHF